MKLLDRLEQAGERGITHSMMDKTLIKTRREVMELRNKGYRITETLIGGSAYGKWGRGVNYRLEKGNAP